MEETKVLIVDDDKALLEALQIAVEMQGYTVRVVSEGSKVIKAVKDFQPDIIMLDVLLSGWDGRDLAVEIKKDPELKTIPLVMLSASAKIEEVADACGADGYISKPFNLEELWSTIEKFKRK